VLEKFTRQLTDAEPLDEQQITLAVEQLIDADVPALTKAEFLSQLARKGETVEEITIFARTLLQKSILPTFSADMRAREILDVVGTGGDRLGTFNISTTVAIVCAAAGVTVAKHGNRGATSRCGSADVLEALGVPIALSPDEAARALDGLGFAFFFAPNYHPAFKNVAAARKLCAERGQRTIFNYLGPLLNPGRPSAMLVGVSRPDLCEPLARVLQSLGVRRAMVVCGKVNDSAKTKVAEVSNSAFLDELSTLGENTIAEFYQLNGFNISTLTTEEFPLQPATLHDLAGSDQQANATIVRRVLNGEERGPKRDAILLNTAAALMVAGRVKTMASGWDLAAETIDSGQAWTKLMALTRSHQPA
jgi:anthranilate phosphoribosyltransferase